MKKISVVVPCYNEEKSVYEMCERVTKMFKNELKKYDYEIIFVDDYSTDNTRKELEKICSKDSKVKAVFNAKNFGFTRNIYASIKYSNADAVFMLFGDLQDPPEVLIEFVKKWEEGYKVIIGQKLSSKESRFMYAVRTLYYKIIGKLSSIKQIPHFNGFGLYDKEFIDVAKNLDDPSPYFRGIVSEFGMNMTTLVYEQEESKRGSSGENFFKNYDIAMTGITSYTKILMRMATFIGGILGIFSFVFAIVVLIIKITNWNNYPVGIPALTIGVFMIGAVQLFFMGIMGEYILSINTRSMKRPLVVVDKMVNFDENEGLDE